MTPQAGHGARSALSGLPLRWCATWVEAMKRVNHWRWIAASGCLLLVSCLAPAEAQTMSRAPGVYNAQLYSRTRQTISNRAAARAALRKRRQPSEAARG